MRTERPAGRGSDFLSELNEQQRAAVLHGEGPLLVIAGAGSGKTRTLTYRAARLIADGLAPSRLLLCTFTNRAGKEMVHRLEGLLGLDLRPLWAGTFHHVANLALRRHGSALALPENYAILDREDARDLMTVCLGETGAALREKRFPAPAVLLQLASAVANSRLRPAEAVRLHAPRFYDLTDELTAILDRFARRKERLGLLDYDDLLLGFHRLLSDPAGPAAELVERFEHVLVDEFQDTNLLQGEIVDLCARGHGNLTVVGDDAQSIYGFRGAHFQNILDFPARYPGAQIFKLELNYRSSPEILSLANASIACNVRQYPKVLRPTRAAGSRPVLLPLFDVYQQAAFVAQRVLELSQEEQVPLPQIAVLYRAHAHSLELQVELTRRKIPYTVRSGLRFFEQAHIKDVLAYLRLAHNGADALAWQRVLKLWAGVGQRSSGQILSAVASEGAVAHGAPVAHGAAGRLSDVALRERLPGAARPAVARLAQLLHEVDGCAGPAAMIQRVVEGHYRDYAGSAFPNAQTRLEDLEQLADYARRFESLEQLLSELALLAGLTAEGVGPGEAPEEKLTLSTVHQAKGLEWRVVFLLWLSEGRFPQALSVRTEAETEEERRLFYVAVTRAMEQLYLCQVRFEESGDGPRRLLRLSRFLSELAGNHTPYERWEIEEAPE
ncbi:MAG: ATP-dependent helicase [Deltaproteobacteria bacterium]|nr:ATP-dependent helicase [Deltaproteobacteria bacterium]